MDLNEVHFCQKDSPYIPTRSGYSAGKAREDTNFTVGWMTLGCFPFWSSMNNIKTPNPCQPLSLEFETDVMEFKEKRLMFMELAKTSSLATLLVFENTINRELIRSLHVYRLADGKENEVEREFVFKRDGPYAEMAAKPLLKLQKFRVSELFEGKVTGSWLCIFAFHADRLPHRIPRLLSISRNPKLKSIPILFSDLEMIVQCGCGAEDAVISGVLSEETFEEDGDTQNQSSRGLPVFDQDLNCLPNSAPTSNLSETEEAEQGHTGFVMVKKKRATSKDIARIAMEDLAKYFDVPIVEASKSLKVGVTVLKRKCRELGIPRWPHRKIKSLDSLIRDLQEETAQWQHEDEAAAFAVAKRRMMLETEKEIIERKPFIELQGETKQFRQDVFKRRHKARALKKQCLSVPPI